MKPETLERLRDLALSNYDVRDLLAEYDRLAADAASRRSIADVDPTGGISQDERAERRRAAVNP